jgi:hypothetical protein
MEIFTLVLVYLLGPVLMLALLYLSKWRRKTTGRRPPFESLLLRSPGHSLLGEVQHISDGITDYLGIASTFPLLLYSAYLSAFGFKWVGKGVALLFLLAGIGAILFSIWKVSKLARERRDKRIGYAGEMATGEELNRLMLDGYRVYHDFPTDRFNIDHILVGPSGVFAVETKARSKGSRGNRKDEAKVIYDGECLRFPTWVTTEPIDQAKAQATWLSKWLSSAVGDPVKVSPMVTIPGWYIERKSPNGVLVLNPKGVRSYLDARKESVLSESMIKRISHQLEQKCRDVDLWAWY